MKLKPVLTEKSLKFAEEGKYTFVVDKLMNKFKIKELVESTFAVTVTKVRTINIKGEIKKTVKGRIKRIKPFKKAIVVVKEGDKIDLFGGDKKKKNK